MKLLKTLGITYFIIFFNSAIHAKYTMIKEMKVKQLTYQEDKKSYLVDFFQRSGRFHAKPRDLACLQDSLDNNKSVKIEFVAMGLRIIDCQTVESK